MKVPVRIRVDIDLDAYRREYGEPEATAADAREYVRALAEMSVDQVFSPFDYAKVVEVQS